MAHILVISRVPLAVESNGAILDIDLEAMAMMALVIESRSMVFIDASESPLYMSLCSHTRITRMVYSMEKPRTEVKANTETRQFPFCCEMLAIESTVCKSCGRDISII
jgi:hypothetical protein